MKPEELKDKLDSVVTVVCTPFKNNYDVNYEGLKENINFLVENGKNRSLALIVMGSVSEFYACTEEEQKKVISAVVDAANGKIPVIVYFNWTC